eukprot:11266251-Ditylum_brightwellii.AAC.1
MVTLKAERERGTEALKRAKELEAQVNDRELMLRQAQMQKKDLLDAISHLREVTSFDKCESMSFGV